MSTDTAVKPTPGRREANIEARRQRILEAARNLLAEGGPEGLSMRKLAREADLSVTTLYNLVGSRDDILQFLIGDSVDRLEASAGPHDTASDPLQRIVGAMESSCRYMRDNASLLRPLIVANFSSGYRRQLGTAADVGQHFREHKQLIWKSLDEAASAGLTRPGFDQFFVLSQIWVAFELAMDRWAFGNMDDEELRLRSLCGVYYSLLAVVTDECRSPLAKALRRLERKLPKG